MVEERVPSGSILKWVPSVGDLVCHGCPSLIQGKSGDLVSVFITGNFRKIGDLVSKIATVALPL